MPTESPSVDLADARMGVAWWNALTRFERLQALLAANTDCPAEAWAHGKTFHGSTWKEGPTPNAER